MEDDWLEAAYEDRTNIEDDPDLDRDEDTDDTDQEQQ